MEGADWNILWRINFHSCFLELDIGVGAGIHGEQTQKLGWGETIKQLQYGEISAVTTESETHESESKSST